MSRASTYSAASWLSRFPEYLIEAWALGMFMVSACTFTILFEYPGFHLQHAIGDANIRRALVGIAMGVTAVGLIYSPWGKRSGAHMNPAITLAFLSLGKISRIDALFYIVAQCIGGLLGVLLTAAVFRNQIATPAINYVVTVPLPHHVLLAFAAESLISFLIMIMVLYASNSPRFGRYTGIYAGILIALFITFEAPYSGMSMNPARSLASALPADVWTSFWIYLIAPTLAMQIAAVVYRREPNWQSSCAKLLHTAEQRCIHCGFDPLQIQNAAAA